MQAAAAGCASQPYLVVAALQAVWGSSMAGGQHVSTGGGAAGLRLPPLPPAKQRMPRGSPAGLNRPPCTACAPTCPPCRRTAGGQAGKKASGQSHGRVRSREQAAARGAATQQRSRRGRLRRRPAAAAQLPPTFSQTFRYCTRTPLALCMGTCGRAGGGPGGRKPFRTGDAGQQRSPRQPAPRQGAQPVKPYLGCASSCKPRRYRPPAAPTWKLIDSGGRLQGLRSRVVAISSTDAASVCSASPAN